MFNDVEETAEAAGLLARYPMLRAKTAATLCPVEFSTTANAVKLDTRGFSSIFSYLHRCCIFATFRWT